MSNRNALIAALTLIVLAALFSYAAALLGPVTGAGRPTDPGAIPSWTDQVQAWSAAATAAFTLVLLVVSVRQWRVGEASAKAALTSAHVAREALIVAARPILSVQFSPAAFQIPASPSSHHQFWGDLFVTNEGSGVVFLDGCLAEFVVQRPGLPVPVPAMIGTDGAYDLGSFWIEDLVPESQLLRPNDRWQGRAVSTFSLSIEDVKGLRQEGGDRRVFFLVRLNYRDALGITRAQTLTYTLRPGEHGESWTALHGADYAREHVVDYGPLQTNPIADVRGSA